MAYEEWSPGGSHVAGGWPVCGQCAAQQAEGIEDGKVGSTMFPPPPTIAPLGLMHSSGVLGFTSNSSTRNEAIR